MHAVDRVSFTVARGEVVGLVGESGCGKSVTAPARSSASPAWPGRHVGGSIMFEGRELLACPRREMRAIRGRGIAMIFQDPLRASTRC